MDSGLLIRLWEPLQQRCASFEAPSLRCVAPQDEAR